MSSKKLAVWKTIQFEGVKVNLTRVTPKGEGFKSGANRQSFIRSVISSRVRLCPVGLTRVLREEYKEQKVGEIFRVAESSPTSIPPWHVWILKMIGQVKASPLSTITLETHEEFCSPGEKWIFVLPPEKPKEV